MDTVVNVAFCILFLMFGFVFGMAVFHTTYGRQIQDGERACAEQHNVYKCEMVFQPVKAGES